MKLRNINKMNKPNDGTRSFFESIFNKHVLTALKYLSHNKKEFIIINDLAISFHTKPFMCKKIEILVKEKSNFKYFPNNICKNIELIIYDLNDLNINDEEYKYALDTAYLSNNFKISSPTFLMNLFLKNFNIDNKANAFTICLNSPIKRNELFSNIHEFDIFIY